MKGNESVAESLLVAIVDDDASMRNSTRRLIRSFGFRAEAFASGREFLDSGCLTETACLILDVQISGSRGAIGPITGQLRKGRSSYGEKAYAWVPA